MSFTTISRLMMLAAFLVLSLAVQIGLYLRYRAHMPTDLPGAFLFLILILGTAACLIIVIARYRRFTDG